MRTTFTFIIGDPSADGHGQTTSYQISSNKSLKEFKNIYNKFINANPELNFNNLNSEYEDYYISQEVYNALKFYGVLVDEYLSSSGVDKSYYWETDDYFVQALIDCLNIFDSSLEAKIETNDVWATHLGYGLFGG
jgi:hypothetical protein